MASFLSYNGIVIDVSRTTKFVQQYLYSPDGADRIGTKFTVEVEGLYAPGATSYQANPLGGGALAVYGHIAPTTDGAIREALATPRCQLVYTIGSVEVLRSPAEGMLVDVAGGPTPVLWEAAKITERAWHVRFRVETTVSECDASSGDGIMSNRWVQAHRIGPDKMATIVTEGVAIFRLDRLVQLDKNADHFRDKLLPPTPLGFQRQQVEVAVNQVGNVVQYRITDQERMVSIGNNVYGVVDFAAVVSLQTVPVGSGAISSVASEIMLATFQGTAFGSKGPGYLSGNLLTWLTKLAIERLDLPVPGNENAENGNYVVTNVATQAAIDQAQASLSITVRVPPVKTEKKVAGLGSLRVLELLKDVRQSALFNADGQNPNLPFAENSRGYFMGELYAQTLRVCLANCGQPEVPRVIATVSPVPVSFQPEGTNPVKEDEYAGDPASDSDRISDATKDGGQITYFEVRTHYESDTGTSVSPVAGNGAEPPSVFQLYNPITYRVVQFTGERIGAKPPVPDAATGEPGEILVGTPKVSFAPPIPAADSVTPIYRVTGEFTYARVDGKSITSPGDGLPMGSVPWATFAFEDASNRYLSTDKAPGITGPSYGGGGT